MYTQVRYLPSHVTPHIVCERKENLGQFAMPHIHCLSDASAGQRTIDRLLRKLSVRNHLGFLTRKCQSLDAHILHSHFGHYGWAELGAARSAGVKHVVTFYGLDVNFLPRQNARWGDKRYPELFSQIDLILCEGSHMGRCIAELGCPAHKIKVQHLGIRIDEIEFAPRSWHKGDPFRVLIAASFREKKGIPYALEALAKIQHRVDLEITVIGDAGPEPRNQREKEKILSIIEKHGFKKIRLLGYQPQHVLMEEAYQHHIFLSPSVTASDGDTEGGAPVSLIEMSASGMMVVSTTHCDIPEVIVHKKTGLLAPERDAESLANHLIWLIEHPDQWEAMLQAGRQHVQTHYDAQTQGQQLANHYQDLVQG